MGPKFQVKSRAMSKDENTFALKTISCFSNFTETYALTGSF